MPIVKREVAEGYIVVHHVFGDRQAIEFLRISERDKLERLCNTAKREGEAKFTYKNQEYVLLRNPDASFSVFREDERPEGIGFLNG